MNRWLYSSLGCDGILCSGQLVRSWVVQFGWSLPPLKVLHFGAPELEYTGITNSFLIPENGSVLCLLGRAQPVKGHLICLDAFAQLKRKDVTLLFLVKILDEFPEQMQCILEKIKALDLEDRVIVAGQAEDLSMVLDQVDIGLIPSLGSEVNCRVLVEFFSKAVPVVAFPVGTLPDLIQSGKNGWICGEKSVGSLVEGIEEALDKHVNWGCNAKQDYQHKYSLAKFSQEFLDFYESVRRR